ncbi:MAG: DNA replication protein [Pseudomonadota bacterium]|nr:DNA replication protein [Pseudomonadota bacterium]
MTDFVQLPLMLSYRKDLERGDFVVAPCNREAVSWIDKWPNWPVPCVLIYGEKGSGKTHLASIFSEYRIEAESLTDQFMPYFQKKIVVENVENVASEEALFHLINFMRDLGGYLLLTARQVPNFQLTDLKTRIQAIPKAAIGLPDEAFIKQVLVQIFSDRQIVVDDAVLDYAVMHMPRSFKAVQDLIQTADALSLAQGRKITIPVIKETLIKIGEVNAIEKNN